MVAPLRDYQHTGVDFLLSRKRCLLGDGMGLGKTRQVIEALKLLRVRSVVVCPNYVKGVWGGELRKWGYGGAIYLPKGTKAEEIPKEATTLIVNYDILHAWADAIIAFAPSVVVFDECHALMSDKSKRSKAAKAIASSAAYVWGLSGTPLTNRPKDLWNILDTVVPRRFGGFFTYALRYCNAFKTTLQGGKVVWDFSGKSNLPELHDRLKPNMLRRLATEVALQLPPKTRQLITLTGRHNAASGIVAGISLPQLRVKLDSAAEEKLPHILSLLESHIVEGMKVVCFTYRRSVAERVVNHLRGKRHDAYLIHGGVSTLQRGKAISEASNAVEGSCLVATIDSASVGIDLSYASVCVFAEVDYKPHALLQAEARLHRFGQQLPTLIQYVILEGSYDELISNVVIAKLDTFEEVIGSTGEGLQDSLSEGEEALLEGLGVSLRGYVERDEAEEQLSSFALGEEGEGAGDY